MSDLLDDAATAVPEENTAGEPKPQFGTRTIAFAVVALLLAGGLLVGAVIYQESAKDDRDAARADRGQARLALDAAVKRHDLQAVATATASNRAQLANTALADQQRRATSALATSRELRAAAASILAQANDESTRATTQEQDLGNGRRSAYNAAIDEYNRLYTDAKGPYLAAIAAFGRKIDSLPR